MPRVRVKIHPGNSHIVHIDGLRDKKKDIEDGGINWVNDATVTINRILKGTTDIISPPAPIAAAYVANSNGDYIAPISETIKFELGVEYEFEIVALGAGGRGQWNPKGKATTRT